MKGRIRIPMKIIRYMVLTANECTSTCITNNTFRASGHHCSMLVITAILESFDFFLRRKQIPTGDQQ